MKKKYLTLLLAIALAANLIACGQQDSHLASNENGSFAKTSDDSGTKSESEYENANLPSASAHWTIDEAIENKMRFACNTAPLYAVDNKLYASYTSGFGYRCLPQYTRLVTGGEASPEIREIRLDEYASCVVVLGEDGKLWYDNQSIFSDYRVKYFDFFHFDNTPYTQVLAAVTEDGRLAWADSKLLRDSPGIKPHLVQGAKNVKYAAAFWGVIAFVREDGTAAWLWANEEDDIQELEGWSDIAMVYVNGDLDDYWNVIGLKKDGSLVSETVYGTETCCPEEVHSWSNIVDIVWTYNCVAGLKSDGSIVYALNDRSDTNFYIETFGVWSNVMAFTESGAITADNTLLGKARSLVYGWNLTKPWVDDEAAYREHNSDDETNQLAILG